MTPLYFLLGIVQSLLNYLFGLSASFIESLFKYSQARGINEKEVAVDLVVVYLLASLNINIEKANLSNEIVTFPRFIMSMSFPLWVP